MIDAYKIGVTIAMTNGVSSVLGVMAKELLGLHGHIQMTEKAFSKMRIAMVGAAGILGGAAILGELKHLTEAAIGFRTEMAKLHGMGFSETQIKTAGDVAFSTATSTPGSSAEGNVKLLGELREIVKSPENAAALLPIIERWAVSYEAQTGKSAAEGVKEGLKAVEMTLSDKMFTKDGGIDTAAVKKGMDNVFKFIEATNGFIGLTEAMTMVKQAGASAEMMDNKTFWEGMVFRAIQQGGARAGTGLAASLRTLSQGPQGQWRGEEWERLHLGHLDGKGPNKHFELGKSGKAIAEGPGGYDAWRDKVLIPALLKDWHMKSQEDEGFIQKWRAWNQKYQSSEVVRRNESMMGNKSGADASKQLFNTVPGFEDQYNYQQDNNPELKMKAFEEAWKNLNIALGLPMVDGATNMMKSITVEINRLAQLAKDHPEAVGNIEKVALALGILMTVGGTLAIASVAMGPFIAATKMFIGVMSGPQVAAATTATTVLGGNGAGSLMKVAFGLTTLAAAAYGINFLLEKLEVSGVKTLQLAIDEAKRLTGQTPDQITKDHDTRTRLNQAIDNFSIFDRNTWSDPNSSIWNASPKGVPQNSQNSGGNYRGSPLDTFLQNLNSRITGENGPTHVIIDNPGAVASANARAMSNGLTAPSTGASGPDNRVSAPVPGGHPQ